MHMIAGVLQYVAVASFAEAWIEKFQSQYGIRLSKSPPSRRRGLKNLLLEVVHRQRIVASFAEAWIENCINVCFHSPRNRRLLRGGVD